MEDELVYAGVQVDGALRWWRYTRGQFEEIAPQPIAEPDSVARAVLSDFAVHAPDSMQTEDAATLARDFAVQFFSEGFQAQAIFVEGHRIRTWLAFLRLCGRAR